MTMDAPVPVIKARLVNLVIPMLTVIALSIFFFWFLGPQQSSDAAVRWAITNTEPNRAMLVALFISVFVTAIVYALQKYGIKEMVPDVISGGNEIMPTLVILAIAWPLAATERAGAQAILASFAADIQDPAHIVAVATPRAPAEVPR